MRITVPIVATLMMVLALPTSAGDVTSLVPDTQAGDGIPLETRIVETNAPRSPNGVQFDARERAWLQTHKTVKIGTSHYPPLTFMDKSGSMAGISADILRLISKKTGITFEAEYFAWPELMEQSKSRGIDMFSGLKNPDRDKYLNFTSPYLNVSYVVINRVNAPFLSNFSNLNGKKVAVVRNWTVHKLLVNKYPNVVVVPYGSLKEALLAVSTSRVEAYVGDLLTASQQIQEDVRTNLKIAAPAPFPDDFVRFAVRKDWPELVTILEKAIQSITREQHEAIWNKWMLVKFEKTVDWSRVWQWVGGVVGILGMVIIWIGFWNRRLKATVKERTGALQNAHDELEKRIEERTEELMGEVAAHQRAEDKITASLAEKEVLLKEIHNRVKNNLQVVSSLLTLQAGAKLDSGSKDVLEESQRRIKVMARIHESLHKSDDLTSIKAREYLNTVTEDAKASGEDGSQNISSRVDVEDIVLDVDHAVACGQIVSELISNSLKHAFPNGQSGEIEVSLHRSGGGKIDLSVTDNGKGFPQGFDFEQAETLGLKLVHMLAMQLNGAADIDGSDGTHVRISFPEIPL